MIDFILEELKETLAQSGLTTPVLATRHGVAHNHSNFFAILERYNPDSCTFFTPVGELGFALHEMHAVSGLPFGEMPYEEFIPSTEELSRLRTAHPEIYATFWETMCHFQICAQLVGLRGGGIMHTLWTEYLFQNLDRKDVAVTRLAASSSESIKARIKISNAGYRTKHLEDGFEAGTEFESFHCQAKTPISDHALLAGFFMIWLKRCVIPSRPIESILAEVVYPAVLLAHGRPVSLLTAMVGCLQSGLRTLTSELLDVKEITIAGKKVLRTPQPRVPMPYTYLMAWFVLHCPSLMTGIMEDAEEVETSFPFVQRFESAVWSNAYIVRARQHLSRKDNYRVFCCGSYFGNDMKENACFTDLGLKGFTALSAGVFRWLLIIRPGYLVFRLREKCIIEPYMPSRFARQLGYAQLYVGNPNPDLAQIGNLCEGARAWYYSSAGGTQAHFILPSSTPECYAVPDFCNWFCEVSRLPGYNMYTSCIEEIREFYDSRRSSTRSRLPGMEDYLSCEQELAAVGKIPEESPLAKSFEAPTVEEPKEDYLAISSRTRRSLGKKALTADEEAEYEKRVRKGKPVELRSSKKPRLMADARRSASLMPKPVAVPDIASQPVAASSRDVITLAIPSELLKERIEQLEDAMKLTVDLVSLGQVTFEDYEPFLTKCIGRIENLNDTQWTEFCRESVVHLKSDLQVFRDLQRADLDSEIEQAFSLIQFSRANHQETLRKQLSEMETQIALLQERRDRAQAELARSTSGSVEEELKKEVAEQVRMAHDKKLSDLKSRLNSIKLISPET